MYSRKVYKYRLIFVALLINILSINYVHALSYGTTCTYFNEDFSGLSTNVWTPYGSGTWTVQNEKLNITQITTGNPAYYATSFSPSDYFVLDTDVEAVSISSGGAYGIETYTTGDVYFSADGKVLAGIGAIIFQSGNAYLTGYDITSQGWYISSTHVATTPPVTSIGVAYSSNAVTLRINKQDTTLKFSGDFSFAPLIINEFHLYAQRADTTVNFDNVCASPLSTVPANLQAPQNLRYTLSGNMLTINWDAVTGATGYKLGLGLLSGSYIGDYDVGNITQIGPFDVSGASGTLYLAVKAYNSAGESGYSNEITVIFGTASMQAPQNFRYLYDSNNLLTIIWDAVSGASGYKIGVGIQAGSYVGFYDIGNIPQIGPFDPNILAAGTYFFVMRAYNSSLESGDSNEIALKAGSSVTEPVDLPGLASSFMGGLGHYNPTTSPAIIATIKSTFHSGGIAALETLATTTYPQFVHSIPNGILLDFGNGYTTKFGDVLTGSIALTHSNIVTAGSRTTGNFSVIANNVHKNAKYLADGSASGAVDITFDANDKVIGDLTFSGIINSAGLSTALMDRTMSSAVQSGAVSGNIHVDGTKCPNYPVSGSVTVTIGGETKTMTFNNKCDGSYSTSHIDSINPNSGKPGDTVTIAGSGFGATQGSSTVKFVGTTATVISWSDTSIVATVPNITSTGDVVVTVGGADSNGVTFTVINHCNTQQVSGHDTPETRVIDLGVNHGTFQFYYQTYGQQDRLIVTYEGATLFDTGCVGASGTENLTYSGSSTSVTVSVVPNCAGGSGTDWNFQVFCPQ